MYLCQIASVPFIFSWQLIGHLAQDECPKQIQTESRWGPRDLSVEERGEEGVASKPEQKQTRTRSVTNLFHHQVTPESARDSIPN